MERPHSHHYNNVLCCVLSLVFVVKLCWCLIYKLSFVIGRSRNWRHGLVAPGMHWALETHRIKDNGDLWIRIQDSWLDAEDPEVTCPSLKSNTIGRVFYLSRFQWQTKAQFHHSSFWGITKVLCILMHMGEGLLVGTWVTPKQTHWRLFTQWWWLPWSHVDEPPSPSIPESIYSRSSLRPQSPMQIGQDCIHTA